MANRWTEAKLFKFLRLYKRYECLWNPYSHQYRNCDAKSEAFSQILYEMNDFGLTIGECLNQIKYLRQTYKQEQKRLENLATLGGRGYSSLLWYPIMYSMLLKVIQDEEKLNQETHMLDLVKDSDGLSSNSRDRQTQKEIPKIANGRRTFPWNCNQLATVAPFVRSSSYRYDLDRQSNFNILNNSNVLHAPNEHISSCPTCGHYHGHFCECFSMNNNIQYRNVENFEDSRSSQSRINYRPRTSYNYRNGILEINSAVRIPVSQQLTNCGYSSFIESITPEGPESNFIPIPMYRQPDVDDIQEEEPLTIECCDDNKGGIINEFNSEKTSNPNPSNLLTSLSLSDEARNLICGNSQPGNSNTDDMELLRPDQKNPNDHIESPRVKDNEKLYHINKKIAKQETNINENMTGTNVKVEETSTLMLETEKKNIPTQLMSKEQRQFGNESLIQSIKCDQAPNLSADNSVPVSDEGRTGRVLNAPCSLEMNNEANGRIFYAENSNNLERESEGIIKNSLANIVINFIDKALKNTDQRTPFDPKKKLILKKVSKDLKALGNKIEYDSMAQDHQHSEGNCTEKFRNKTICWREPIEESFQIIPCGSIRFSDNKTNHTDNALVRRSVASNNDVMDCSRLMAGADSGIKNEIEHLNLSNLISIGSGNETTNTNISTSSEFEKLGSGGNEVLNLISEAAQTNLEEYIKSEIQPVGLDTKTASDYSNSGLVWHQNSKLCQPDTNNEGEECSVIIDKESLKSSLQDTAIRNEGISSMQNESNTEHCENRTGNLIMQSDASTLNNTTTEIENGVSINISVKMANSNENDGTDEVVDRITEILRKTLDEKGYTIGRNEFFAKKNLITNNNGEINRKTIANETVWKTELRNIIIGSMRRRRTEDSITFKVKTVILPVANQTNSIAEADINSNTLIDIANTRHMLQRMKNTACDVGSGSIDSQVAGSQSTKCRQLRNKSPTKQSRRAEIINRQDLLKLTSDNSRHLDKKLIKDVDRIVQSYNDHPYALWKLWKHLMKIKKKYQSIVKMQEKSLDNELQQSQFTNQCAKTSCDFPEDVDVYLWTEISQEDQLSMEKDVDCDSHSYSSESDNVIENFMQRNINSGEECDISKWEFHGESDGEIEIVKRSGSQTVKRLFTKDISFKKFELAENLNQEAEYCSRSDIFRQRSPSAVYAQNGIGKNTCSYRKRTYDGEQKSNGMIPPITKDPQEESECRMSAGSDFEKGESLINAKLKTAADNQIKSCCMGNKTSNICTPICDVTSHLRLCAILKSPKESKTADRMNLSDNICCCDGMDKLLYTTTKTDRSPRINQSKKNARIGDANVRSMSASSQTKYFQKELQRNIAGQESHEEIHSKGFSAIDLDEEGISKDTELVIDDSNRESNTQNMVSTSLDVSALKGGPMILEIKMLQPLFSIELKKAHEDIEKAELSKKLDDCEFIRQKELELNAPLPAQQPAPDFTDQTTSTDSLTIYRLQRIRDEESESVPLNDEDKSLSGEIQGNSNCKLVCDLKERIKECSDNSRAQNSNGLTITKKNGTTSTEDNLDKAREQRATESGVCDNNLLDTLRLQDCENPCGFNELSGVLASSKPTSRKEGILEIPPLAEEKNSLPSDNIEPIIMDTLMNAVEKSLEHVTNPIIREKLVDVIKCIRNPDQNSSYSFKESHQRDNLKVSLGEKEFGSENELLQRSLTLISNGECHISCKTEEIPTRNSSKNMKEFFNGVAEISEKRNSDMRSIQARSSRSHSQELIMEQIDDQIPADESRAILPIPENSHCQRTRLPENNNSDKSLKYFCCDEELSTDIDIDAFAVALASQLRGLSTEAALRAQQRIQTLVSSSRLESEKNKKYR